MMRFIQVISFLILLLSAFLLTLKFVRNVPYFYMAAEFFLASIFIILKTRKEPKSFTGLRVSLFYAAVMILSLGLGEVYIANSAASNAIEGTYYTNYCVPDETLGYAAAKNRRVTAKKIFKKAVAYDVAYTTNPYGLRISPRDAHPPESYSDDHFKNVVFFGCSFTLGEGVKDDETFPYLVEEKSHGKYRTYNFGFHGYGPHQMLRVLESDLLRQVIQNDKQSIAVYLALPAQIDRSSGNYPYSTWDIDGPMYRLNSSGEAEYAGTFRKKYQGEFWKKDKRILNQLMRSYIFKEILWRRVFGWKRSRGDTELFVQIIKKSQEIFQTKYRGRFYVVLWAEHQDEDYDSLLSMLNKNGLKVITTDEIFGTSGKMMEKYKIDNDPHPNALAHERLASYILEYLQNTE